MTGKRRLRKRRKPIKRRHVIANVFLVACSLLASLAIMEVAARLLDERPVFALKNWILDDQIQWNRSSQNAYDPLLGWVSAENFQSPSMNMIEHGIRKNGPGEERVSPGGILVVGDSFAAGSEVGDAETWPAYLEEMLGVRVYNAGVGGYGTDQIILRAEQLLPLLKPSILIVGMLEQDIRRNSFSVYGGPKPYFLVRDGKLQPMNYPVPDRISETGGLGPIQGYLGYSYLFHRLMLSLSKETWLELKGANYQTVVNDPVVVTCLLLDRLREKARHADVRVVVMMQHGAPYILPRSEPTPEAQLVSQCAAEMGIQVVDEFEPLKAIAEESRERFDQLYVLHPEGPYGLHGHMSPQGNYLIASLLAEAIRNPPKGGLPAVEPDGSRALDMAAQIAPGGEDASPTEIDVGKLQGAGASVSLRDGSDENGDEYLIRTDESAGEHYARSGPVAGGPGLVSLSLLVRDAGTHKGRLQLLGSDTTGVFVDFDTRTGEALLQRIGLARFMDGSIEPSGGGWYRVTGTTAIDTEDFSITIQLMDREGSTQFSGSGEGLRVKDVRVERR